MSYFNYSLSELVRLFEVFLTYPFKSFSFERCQNARNIYQVVHNYFLLKITKISLWFSLKVILYDFKDVEHNGNY